VFHWFILSFKVLRQILLSVPDRTITGPARPDGTSGEFS
jgi:hypothetical protein